MSIHRAGKIFINGSTNAFGGYVYSANFTHQYGQSPSTLSLSIISTSREYLPVRLSAVVPYTVKFDDEISLKMYATSWKITDGTNGKILNVNFVDGRMHMNRKPVVLSDFPCRSNSQDIIFLGTVFDSSTNNGASSSTDGSQTFFSYDYAMLQAASPIKLPDIPNQTNLFRLNTEGSLGQVFSEFCTAYGFTWYWDYTNDVPILLDLRTDVNLDLTLPTKFIGLPCLKSFSYGESIDGLEAQGVVFYNNDTSDTVAPTQPIFAVKNIFDEREVLSQPLFDKEDIEAAKFAVWGEDIYNNYIFSKYALDLNKAFDIFGYKVITIRDFANMTPDQQNNIQTKSKNNADYIKTAKIVRTKRNGDQNTAKAAHFRMADAMKAGQVGWIITPFTISSSTYEINEVSEDGLISAIPGIGNFIKTDIDKYDSFNNPSTISSRTTMRFYVVKFPKLRFVFDAFEKTQDKPKPPSLDATFPFQLAPLSDGWQMDGDTDQQDEYFFLVGTAEEAPVLRVDGLIGYIFADVPSLGANSPLLIANSYSSKYKNALCNIPQLNDLITSFRINSLTNDGTISPFAAMANAAILPTRPHQSFDVEVYGINTGLGLTPEKGLDGFTVNMGDDGYETAYTMSSKQRIPLDIRLAKNIYI